MRTLCCILLLLFIPFCSASSSVFRVTWQVEIINKGPTDATNVIANIFIFDNIEGFVQQRILAENIPVETQRTSENRIAVIRYEKIRAGEIKRLNLEQLIRVDRVSFDLKEIPDVQMPPELLPLTVPIEYLWENTPELYQLAKLLGENAKGWLEKARNIFEFVKSHMNYERQEVEHSAQWAYLNRIGDCTEFTNLFIALCRLAGIPSKFVCAVGYKEAEELSRIGHAFSIIYLPTVGWIPVDPTWSAPAGEFGVSSEDKLVFFTSDGTDLVKNSTIRIPRDRINYSYIGVEPNIVFRPSANIRKEVDLKVELSASSIIQDKTWEWCVRLTNRGPTRLENLVVRLSTDNLALEQPPLLQVPELFPGDTRNLFFPLKVKQNVVENLPVKAEVEYMSPYGRFTTSSNTIIASAFLPPEPAEELLHFLSRNWIYIATGLVTLSLLIVLVRRF